MRNNGRTAVDGKPGLACAGAKCCSLWAASDIKVHDLRRYYSLFTLGMLVMFECTVVGQRLRNLRELRALSTPKQAVQVYRHGKWDRLPGDALLPGDLISLGRPAGGAAPAPPRICCMCCMSHP